MAIETVGTSSKAETRPSPLGAAAQKVYDDLRNRIVQMELPPDSTLSRADLARDYEVSLMPIRDAMQRLERDGLIRVFPQSKTVVTRIDIQQLHEAHFLRVAVESEIVRRIAVAGADEELIGRLRSLLRMQAALVDDTQQYVMFNEIDEAFHKTLFGAVDQIGLYDLVHSKSGHLARVQRLDLPKEGKMRDILSKHSAIVDAIEARNPELAQQSMRAHLSGSISRIEASLAENPSYFRT